MRAKFSQLSPVKRAVVMTGVAAILIYLWVEELLLDLYAGVGGVIGSDVGGGVFQLLVVLTWFVILGSAAVALACWLKLLSRSSREKPEHRYSEGSRLRFAKASSLVATILLAGPIALWSYWELVPRDCSNEACIGEGYLLISLAMAAAAGVLFAISIWAIYFARDRQPGDRFAGLWVQVLLFDAALLLVGKVGDEPGAMVLVLVAALAYFVISLTRRRLGARA